ncbi:histidine kinase [Spirosoma montaniterrae]|uniref:histidine kinase n=2 Tax=Spirosoma montaniterrae TaxID=1178516 RepID=A0A1P9WVV2_9BACT|nr:histidine kinase [Spirosoma montaniterrae]
MEQLIDFFQRLFQTNDWPPRWFCGRWTDFHGWLYIVSDLTIWLAYMAIPLILIRFVVLKKGVPLPGVFVLFGAFILLCGATHLLDAMMFWWPAYRFSAFIRFLTGVVSVATVIALIRYFNEAVGLKTSREFDRELVFRQQAMQELARSNQELQQFAYVASHDLQSPLKTIVNYLTLLETKYGNQLDGDAQRLIDTSTAAAGRMRILINDLLDFSRVGSVTEFQPVDMNQLVAEILTEHQDDIETANATVEVGPLPVLTAHRTDLKQVFQNLITNGLKYRRVDVPTKLSIQATDLGDAYQFAVADNGIGIEPQYHERVFQIFQRLHGRNEYPGTGIGLATCKKVIDIYGGQIWLTSIPGAGTTFYLTIPKEIKTVQHYAQTNSLHPVD